MVSDDRMFNNHFSDDAVIHHDDDIQPASKDKCSLSNVLLQAEWLGKVIDTCCLRGARILQMCVNPLHGTVAD